MTTVRQTIWAMIPTAQRAKLCLELASIGAEHHDDMLQEAALAVLEGNNAATAAARYRRREENYNEHEICEARLGLEPGDVYADVLK